jgi:hypothetical protein
MKTTLAAALVTAMLAGCAGSPVSVGLSSEEGLKSETTASLCAAYAANMGRDKIERELWRRDALTTREWASVVNRKVFVGMSREAAICAWGRPEKINRTTTQYGGGEQWVYLCLTSNYRGCNYLYLRGDTVSAIQN